MSIADRAKQFAPFAAVGGLDVAIARMEWEHGCRDKIELSEESCAELNQKLSVLQDGDGVEIKYFENGHYVVVQGTIDIIDYNARELTIEGRRILFEDIYTINI